MLETKILEVRDRGTFIAVLAVNMNCGPTSITTRYYLRRYGYPCDGRPNIAITRLDASGEPFWNDPYCWSKQARTMPIAHEYIIKNWNQLENGDVVDVEFIEKEQATVKISERFNF